MRVLFGVGWYATLVENTVESWGGGHGLDGRGARKLLVTRRTLWERRPQREEHARPMAVKHNIWRGGSAHLDIDLQFRRQLHEAQNMFV